MTKSKTSKASSEFSCPYCAKSYKRENSLLKHSCEYKKRYLDRDTRQSRLAYLAFTQFMKTHFHKNQDFATFARSPYYGAFYRFARYILDVDAVSRKEFITHMVESGIRVDDWCVDRHYIGFVKKILMSETPHRALERTVILMQEWAIRHQCDWKDFFKDVSTVLAVDWINYGRLSPWVILNCDSGRSLLGRLSSEQKGMIAESINTRVWLGKFERFPNEVKDIRQALLEEGL